MRNSGEFRCERPSAIRKRRHEMLAGQASLSSFTVCPQRVIYSSEQIVGLMVANRCDSNQQDKTGLPEQFSSQANSRGNTMSKRSLHYRPRLESLEARKLMAGDVVAALEGNFLRVEGDNLDNQIAIAQTFQGDVIVSGQNGTLINGLASVRFVRPQINALEVRMEGGNDTVALRGLNIANDLFVDLGAGDDRLTSPATGPVTVGANASIFGSEGNDTLQLGAMTVREDLYVDGGIGALNASLNGVQVDKVLSVIGDEAIDVVNLSNTRASLGVNIETKGGSDRVNLTDIAAFAVSINTDANSAIGADQVNLTRVTTVEDLGIFTGLEMTSFA